MQSSRHRLREDSSTASAVQPDTGSRSVSYPCSIGKDCDTCLFGTLQGVKLAHCAITRDD